MAHRPNVLIFMLDTLRAKNVSCYGYEKPTTPNIDRIAEEGSVFLDNVSPAIWTLPAVASLMTGLHVHSHGSGAHNESFDGDLVTMADVFSDMNYMTAAFYGNIYGAMSNKGFRESRMIWGPDKHIGPDGFDVSRRRIEDVMSWLDRNHGDDSPPFFVYIQVMDPHMRYYPVSPFKEQFVLPDATDEEINALEFSPMPLYTAQGDHTKREIELLLSMYDAEIAAGDSHVGVLVDYLRQADIIDDTIVFIMSDHGEMFCEHESLIGSRHYTHHLACYEELIGVPLVARYPDAFPAGSRVERSTQTHDIFPTLAEIIGFDAPHCQGFSLLSASGDNPERTYTLTEYQKSVHIAARAKQRVPDIDQRFNTRSLKAYRKDGMKYIWASDMRDELYDLRADPKEQSNLMGQLPEKANEMRLELEDLMTRFPQAPHRDYIISLANQPDLTAALRGMGWFLEM